ncbi:hypothetical protein ElyMa_001890100 [Elysia marginata]|uniref:Lamina-associated polypeptide 2 alpha C-terminal domain-containing protein n=1 Tax=Elysia marginata TaxID=1093978 RepID=A0AAV4EQY4_9GAST|nr:hypothetical protein ElyMa_001890100 [Elysia marginata]
MLHSLKGVVKNPKNRLISCLLFKSKPYYLLRFKRQKAEVTRPISSGEIVSSAAELENELCNVASDASEKFTEPPASDDVFATVEAELLSSDEVGPPLMEKLGTFVTNRFSKKLDEAVLKKKLSEQKRPSNCPSLSAPLTNPLIWQVLGAPYKRNDTRLTNAQINISKAATAVALAVEHLHDLKDQAPSLQKPLGSLLDAVSLLGHTHQHLTAFRKDAQRYALPRDFKDVCNVEASDSKFLYGDDIKKSLREAKEDKRLTYSLRLTNPPSDKKRSLF